MTNTNAQSTREITAAVVRDTGGPFRVERLTLEAPRRDEVNRPGFIGGLHMREDEANVPTNQVCPGVA